MSCLCYQIFNDFGPILNTVSYFNCNHEEVQVFNVPLYSSLRVCAIENSVTAPAGINVSIIDDGACGGCEEVLTPTPTETLPTTPTSTPPASPTPTVTPVCCLCYMLTNEGDPTNTNITTYIDCIGNPQTITNKVFSSTATYFCAQPDTVVESAGLTVLQVPDGLGSCGEVCDVCPSSTPTQTPSQTPSNSQTPSQTETPTRTPTQTQTPSQTITQTQTQTPSQTQTQTPSQTQTQTPTQTLTQTQTPSQTQTQTASQTPSLSPGASPTQTETQTQTPTQTPTNTPTQTQTLTQTPSQTQTNTQSPTNTISPTSTPSTTPIRCGRGVTTGNYYYTDCCGTFTQGSTVGINVIFDYNLPFLGVVKLNVPASIPCSTPTSTITPTQTPTITKTPTTTPSNTPTSSLTPTPTQTPSKAAVKKLVNDCDVFTSFPMGVECSTVLQPSKSDSLDGILTLKVTGGTSPYSFWWANGQRSQTLAGIGAGSYEALVIDYYGDYSARTVCSLFGPTPNPTTTPTQTPTPTRPFICPNLCLIIISPNLTFGPAQFVCNGFYNNKLRWTYTSLNYSILWDNTSNRWILWNNSTNGPVTFNNGSTIIVSTSNQNVPDSAWTFIGAPVQGNISVTRGNCPSTIPLQVSFSVQNTNCGNINCNGSILMTASNGVPPYQFSINNGLTYQTSNIFNGLCPNTYSITTRDSVGSTFVSTAVVTSSSQIETYNVYSSISNILTPGVGNKIAYWDILTNLRIPLGTNIQGTLVITTTKTFNGPGTGVIDTTNNVYQNGNLILPFDNPSVTVTEQRPNCPQNRTIVTTYSSYNVELSSGPSLGKLSGYTNSTMQITDSQNQSGCATLLEQTTTIVMTNCTIKGCECCEVVVNPRPAIFNNQLAAGQIQST